MEFSQLSNFDKFVIARWAYSVGQPVISDAEYQILLDAMKVEYPNSPYVLRSWSSDPCPVDRLKSIGRDDLIAKVVLADKTTSIKSLGSFAEIQAELSSIHSPGTLSMKHDGWNVQANYHNQYLVNIMTRGRATDATDVSHVAALLPNQIPVSDTVKIALELTCPKRNFPYCNAKYGNVSERTAVSTLLAHKEEVSLLELHALEIHGYAVEQKDKFKVLESWGFNVPKWYNVTNYDTMLSALEVLSGEAQTYDSPTDGAVYDGDARRALRVLFWEEPIYKSYVIGYLEQFGANRISPSIKIYPILRKGTTQRQVNMTNWQRIMDYNLKPGAPVAFRIASDANAAFDESMTKLLQQTYHGREEEYQRMIQDNERLAEEKWRYSLL